MVMGPLPWGAVSPSHRVTGVLRGGVGAVVLAVRGGETGPRARHLTREIVT